MKNLWQNKVLRSPEPEVGGGAGGQATQTPPAAGSILTPSAGGSGTAAAQGGASTPPTPGAGNPPAGNSSAGGNSGGSQNADWRSQLPAELQEDATLKKYGSVPALAAAYLNAQKLIGAEKIPVPGKHSTEEDWKNVFTKLGLPETVDKYDVKFKEGVGIDEKFTTQFKESAHKLGILPQQAQKLADWFSDINLNADKELTAQMAAESAKSMGLLKAEWGNAFGAKAARINKLLDEHGGDELKAELEKRGLGHNVPVMKALAAMADKLYKEDKHVDGSDHGTPLMTPSEAKKAAMAIIGDKNHPYHDKNHPNHLAAVKEVQGLFTASTPQV